MNVKITRAGEDVAVQNPNAIPIVYQGESGPRLNVNELNRVKEPIKTSYVVTIPEGVRGVLTATGELWDNNPGHRNPTLIALRIPDGFQYLDPGEHKLEIAVQNIRPVGSQAYISTGDTLAILRFETIPAIKINAKPGRPKKEAA